MTRSSKTVLVVGGGPAGMMAALAAAGRGASVTLLDRMDKPGKKILVT
ncbi:MAG TPA: FAD-dependent oxidoreductase, partial [Elusimicrobiota bacterium]|nr:FAD-dependent oxidoreductase [Elusimicrobiota bacterium]